MSHPVAFGVAGDSYFSILKTDMITGFENSRITRMGVLPAAISPFEKQIRVAVNGVEYPYDDGTVPGISTFWSYVTPNDPGQPTGVLVSQLRIRFESGTFERTAQFGIRDGNGVWMTDLAVLADGSPDVPNGGGAIFVTGDIATDTPRDIDNAFDQDGTTIFSATGQNPSEILITFVVPRVVSAFGWAGHNPPDSTSIAEMEVEINVGIPLNTMALGDENFISVEARTGIVQGDYTDPDFFDPRRDLLIIEIPSSLGSEDDLVRGPIISVTPPLALDEDRLTIWRETRQDRPHNPPVRGAYANGDNLHYFLKQRLYIMQDLCEYQELGPLLDFPPYTGELHDFTIGSQIQEFLNHSTEDNFSFADLELLDGIPGVSNLGNQIIIEEGESSDGTSVFWTAQAVPSQYTVNSTTKIVTRVAGNTTTDVRIRRDTKMDDLWVDLRGQTLPWNSLIIVLLLRQIRFLVEEACYVPVFFASSLLDNTIFPREWNWLIYTGTDLFHIFGGPFWTGDGEVVVYDNDILLTDPTDYTTEYPQITFTGPITEPHIGSTGNYWVDGGEGFPGDGTDAPGGQDQPPDDTSPIDPLDPVFNAIVSIGIGISYVTTADMLAGVEGFPGGISAAATGTNIGGFGDANLTLKLRISVTIAFGAQTTVNRRVVAYCGGVCDGAVLFGLKAVAKAIDNNGDGTFETTVEASGALGCSDGAGHIQQMVDIWNDWLAFRGPYSDREVITANERAFLQIIRAEDHHSGSVLDGETVIAGLTALSNENIGGGAAGGTDESDINDIMGP